MSIGERITNLRKQNDLTQGQLATLMEVSRQAISKWEHDQASPDTLNLIKLAEVLNSDIEYLATGQEKADPADVEPIVMTVVKEVEKVVETVVEKPIIRRRIRIRYRDNPTHMLMLGGGCFLIGLILGLLL